MTDPGPPDSDLRGRARGWRDADPDPTTRAAVDQLLRDGDDDRLGELFGTRLAFGTAGLRGPLGPGPNRMNRLVVRQTAAGLARVLHAAGSVAGSTVVVGRDARSGSAAFADDVAAVLVAHGIDVHMIDGPAPTPLAAFALTHLHAVAAVVVTASHNPPDDNGIKVYWQDGAQIVPPVDGAIAAAITAAAEDGLLEPADTHRGTVHHLGTADGDTPLVRAYLDAAGALVPGPPTRPVPLAATSLHGVGAGLLDKVLTHMGHGPLRHVASQREPDPAFPTVAFPNPEEPGALDELLALAAETGASLALANDPDADRLALAAARPDGTWHALSGDETAAVLAHHLLALTDGIPERLLVTTVVSSRLLAAMAEAAGVHFAETLTGFKWLCRPALEHPQWHQVMAYEEALGYAIGPTALDKDGITAALVAADAACSLAAAGRSVWDVLDDLAQRHGAHVTANGSTRLGGSDAGDRMATISSSLAAAPPTSLGGLAVRRSDLPAPDVLRLWLEDDTRVVLRPSGTEPKFKRYCEAIEPIAARDTPEHARSRARERLDAVVSDLEALLG